MTPSPHNHWLLLPPISTIAGAAVLFGGCGYPFGNCRAERIEVRMPATVERGGRIEQHELFDAVGPGNVGSETFEGLEDFLIDGQATSRPVVSTIVGFDTLQGALALVLRAPVQEGEVIPVAPAAFSGGGWGFLEGPSESRAQVGAAIGAFTATAAEGTLEVLDASPLRLRADVVLRDGTGATVGIRGDVTFRRVSESVACT